MAKIQFFCSNGFPLARKSSGILDTTKHLSLEEGMWEQLPEEDKWKLAEEWANNHIEIWWEEYEG